MHQSLGMNSTQFMNEQSFGLARKTAALLEVIGIFIVGSAAASYFEPRIGIKPLGTLLQSALNTTEPDFVGFSVGWLEIICVQYVCLLLPAFAIGWWRRRLNLRHYGITKAGNSIGTLVILGLVAFALVALPVKLLWVARHFFSLGQGSPFWALLDKNWTPSFWLFSAVASFAVTPVLEELFFRGYCQTRLEEDFGGVGAIVIVTLFMTLGHNQYHHLNILSIATIVTMIPLFFGMGYLYWRTRSLLPSIILHAAVNFPTKGIYDFLLPVVMIGVLILFCRKWLSMVQDFYQQVIGKDWRKAAFMASAFAVVMVIGFETWNSVFITLAFLGLVIAIFIEFREKRT